MPLSPPERLAPARHRLDGFSCGEESLDRWLTDWAAGNLKRRATITYVVADEAGRVAGFYALAPGAVARRDALRPLRQGMPDSLPVLVLGRLAVDRAWQSRGLGAALLKDAILRAATAARAIGGVALLVHAKNDVAAGFYRRHGFLPCPAAPMTLMLPLAEIS